MISSERASEAMLWGVHRYPGSHWSELSRFIAGNERDPKDQFCLADDTWNAWTYAAHAHVTEASLYRFRFSHLHSFLKPYVKWFCYQRLLGKGNRLSGADRALPYALTLTDVYVLENGWTCLDEIASPAVFAAVWDVQLPELKPGEEQREESATKRQQATRQFWIHLHAHFGAPQVVPPTAACVKRRPVECAADTSRLIPLPVIRQIVNRLALHRDGEAPLNRYHHLRLCVLVLALYVGRRIREVLSAPRGVGEWGPLSRYPARGGSSEGALWFQFRPSKQGPGDRVYISPEWEDIVQYSVQALLRYSDEVREYAEPSEQGLLILVSRWNETACWSAVYAPARRDLDHPEPADLSKRAGKPNAAHQGVQRATALQYPAFRTWLNDIHRGKTRYPGILRQWNITVDGSTEGEVYHLQTHQFRHTRQSALASDPQVSLFARQRDLNHPMRDTQFAYQHTLREQNAAILEKVRTGQLIGPAMAWLSSLLDTAYQGQEHQSRFQVGQPTLLTPRWRTLITKTPQFVQVNRVPCGYCALPQGPEACEEYMNCLEADADGCRWFATDPHNEQMLIQITQRASSHRRRQQESAAAGHTVQAGKYEILAQRAERVEEEALRCASQDVRERLRARKREIEEGRRL